ncbi:2-hydroxy-6-ketonona-2,4-dienedioic acid hydrolase [Exophiala aquamarina CBS 119918]|uniref:2-hydroxy-6-ketonona-2,4-dienedioic acid hydrolase n=1 Tax=Exophiala aquamarina CBS 119918 TaxID=1182545 RepID=A0A072P2Q2_9EURO|nr:2-hydroxy-6-ketonona-2,4-dienedioic acid hydrolase [Exophiala aquamarina CBS 119918]KEF54126.1 2-hydroxy-6-ketonona-2,4-dienedioic acid hydrolase [Exophiala aquamarina CBS 119918]
MPIRLPEKDYSPSVPWNFDVIDQKSTMTSITAENTSRFVTINENGAILQVHYNDCGKGEETVIMLHGSGPGASGWANFHRNVEPLVKARYRVLLIDFPGWGKSDSIVNSESRAALNARVVKAIVDELRLSKVHLVGNSMGGHSSVAFTLEYPEYVGKLVLLGGGTGGVSLFAPMPTEGMKRVTELYRNPTLENLKKFNDIFVYDSSALTEDLLQLRLENMLSRKDHLENFLKSSILNSKQFPDVTPILPDIQKETLIIWGRQDRVMPVDGALRLAAGIPNSEVHLFNKCGHWAQWEHADRFNDIVIGFLKT